LLRQKPLDAVDMTSLLINEGTPLTMLALPVLLIDRWNRHDPPDPEISPLIGNQPTHQRDDVDTIRLRPTGPTVDFQAGGLYYANHPASRDKIPG